jgi:HSP20 family protein
MAEQTIAVPQRNEKPPATQERTRALERFTAPAVDIFESTDGLTVLADLPGVDKNDLTIEVKNDVLTLEGRSQDPSPGASLYKEFELVNFFRQFQISDSIDPGKISAELKHGVLQIHLPKAEAAKPRKIDVQVS